LANTLRSGELYAVIGGHVQSAAGILAPGLAIRAALLQVSHELVQGFAALDAVGA
jgi:hypothetical protein